LRFTLENSDGGVWSGGTSNVQSFQVVVQKAQ
jgi:hypothetical protein